MVNFIEYYGQDGNGRVKEDKPAYIQVLVDARKQENAAIFVNATAWLHCRHPEQDIESYLASTEEVSGRGF